MMMTTQTIPLHQLAQSTANVRVTGRRDGIAELAASIAAHGLRQNLNIRPTASGRFEVVAGGRRLRALKLLAREGRLPNDTLVPCLVLAEGDDPAEISLVENSLRSAMHPDDQCNAFRALIEERGLGLEDVAARFGVTPTVVRRRLKLAQVSPRLRSLFRKGEITLEQMMAFALGDDHAAQEAVWKSLPEWNRDPEAIRDALTGEAVPLTHKLARFIGADSYVSAGGAVLRDLFDEDGAGYLPDLALVQRLVDAKLTEAAETVRGEGWKWVLADVSRDYGTYYRRLDGLAGNDDAAGYTPEDKARAGARLSIEHDGTLRIERGLLHPGDIEAAGDGSSAGAATKPKADPAALSAVLVQELTAHRTAALQQALAANPAVALAATVHALSLSLLYHGAASSCLALRGVSADPHRCTQAPGDGPAHAAMTAEAERWGDRLPGDADGLWAWCLAQPQNVLLELLAFLAACSLNAVQAKHDRPDGGRLAHAERLADAVALDMCAWWTPSVDGFYGRLTKAALVQAVQEAGARTGVAIGVMKKQEAARYVAGLLQGTGWLPVPLRRPVDGAA